MTFTVSGNPFVTPRSLRRDKISLIFHSSDPGPDCKSFRFPANAIFTGRSDASGTSIGTGTIPDEADNCFVYFVETIRNKGEEDWNEIAVAAVGDRVVTFLNGFRVVDLTDPQIEKEGKVGLQLHGGSDGQMWFKNFQVMKITPEQRALIER